MRGLGAEVIFHGSDFDTAREWVAELAKVRGGIFVGPTDEPLICGVATFALEILEELPDVDVIIGPLVQAAVSPGRPSWQSQLIPRFR